MAGTREGPDRGVWLSPPRVFLPHCRVSGALAGETPIWVDHVDDHPGPAAVLINLQAEPPSFFPRFERLVEIVGIDETDAAAGRARFRFYRERGYEMSPHSLAQR